MAELMVADQIRQALERGTLLVTDAQGYQQSFFARCPNGHDAPVYRTEKSREAISRVIFRCPVCGVQFDASPEQMTLK